MSRNKIKLINSNVVETVNQMQKPKLPEPSVLEYGEPAINYAKGFETISIKNSNNEIITFSSDAVFINYIDDKFKNSVDTVLNKDSSNLITNGAIATAINNLSARIDELESRIAALEKK